MPFFGISQLTDTTCLKSRWIALKPTAAHADIFCLDSTIETKKDMIRVIQTLVEDGEINLYSQNGGPNGKLSWNYIDYQLEVKKANADSLFFKNKQPYFTMFGPQSDQPLSNDFGEPATRINANGVEEFLYPSREIFYFPTRIIDEIRIKENRVFNKQTKQFEFIPVGFSFYFNGDRYSRGYELFWIDLNELTKAIPKEGQYPWYDAIVNKKYQGFQYMQVSCYDQEVKY